ncbi:hypothetical protein [Rhizobium sp. CSW-27]|uniref:hypothetical protein n=1 Tax=Rhizobium sp. CSW-27 TaxID=2839985 RepID=UPI001C00FC42|nr:hypothetical protein [Rhizobium sp. CSW-27]MBT9370277.1 hypothetical protein [Rhizobium sp. CSW-27]
MARRVLSIGETVRVLKQDTEDATRDLLVRTAKREHAKVMAADPKPQAFVRIVDGVLGAPEERARPDGVIVYQYQRFDEIVQFAMETLFDLSPVLSGDYRNAHMITIDGVPATGLKDWKPGSEITILNPLPYSRKIEVGSMTMRVAGSDKVYQQARRIVMGRFGNVASIQFTYRAFIGGNSINQAKAPSSGKSWWLGHDGEARAASGVVESRIARTHGATAHNQRDVRFPALVITER